MRINYIHQYYNNPHMSGSTRSYEMARRLVDKGHQVNMITTWRESSEKTGWFKTEEDGVHVHWLRVPYSNHMNISRRAMSFAKFAFFASLKASRIPADVIFATSTPLTVAIPGIWSKKIQKVPMVFEVRDLWPSMLIALGLFKNPITRSAALWLEKQAYFQSECVVALSPGMREGVCRTGYPSQRVAVIPNASDNQLFNVAENKTLEFRMSRDWLGNRPLIVYAGTFGTLNGLHYIVDLARCLRKIAPEVRILLVGDGKERASVIEYARNEGVLGVNLFVENQVPKSNMPVILGAANMAMSVFMDVESMWVNSANKFFDALASSCPVFVNYEGWHAEIVRKYGVGIAGYGRPIETVAQEVADFVADLSKVEMAGHQARLVAELYFDRDVLARQLEEVLMLAVSGNGDQASTRGFSFSFH